MTTPFQSLICFTKNQALREQSPHWAKKFDTKVKIPLRPMDRILKNAGIKTSQDHKKNVTCFSCHKIANLEIMNEQELREYNISAMCKSCQDDFFK